MTHTHTKNIKSKFFTYFSAETTMNYIPLTMPKDDKKKVKNPLDQAQKNPFVYDSSDSDDDHNTNNNNEQEKNIVEIKAVWKENLFFSKTDQRFKGMVNYYFA